MCGIFGIIKQQQASISSSDVRRLAKMSSRRGRDSSGFILGDETKGVSVTKFDDPIDKTIDTLDVRDSTAFVMGHSRLITNGLGDNQPVTAHDVIVLHNGIIVNSEMLWDSIPLIPQLEIDTEIINALVSFALSQGYTDQGICDLLNDKLQGVYNCAIFIPSEKRVLLVSNNGSLFYSYTSRGFIFASERKFLEDLCDTKVEKIHGEYISIEVELQNVSLEIKENRSRSENLIPKFQMNLSESRMLEYKHHELTRCTKCILPETMPFISFDKDGVCNYCTNYNLRNIPKPKEQLFDLVEKYRRKNEDDCIVPFSGGRDSCYGLHLIVNELGLKPIAYTYDWGMVTDLGRRNISRVCSRLGVENIVVAADIGKKRKNIKMNLEAWLKSPHLGMIALLTAGDKHFFRYLEYIKKETGIGLNLWGVNPLEVTHFKTGFLGIPPDFAEEKVYSNGVLKQLDYHAKRTQAMFDSPGYFNTSLFDTLLGEYYRSVHKKTDYFHIFDYWRWDEELIDSTLLGEYDWEKATDTTTTWRIGDGTAALYNYIYYTIAGFTEHDTFRSNQVREGQLTREEALSKVSRENAPRYENIRWYLDTLDMEFTSVISRINSAQKLF